MAPKPPKKKKKRTYASMLKGYQEVPMDLDKINASFEATQKPKE